MLVFIKSLLSIRLIITIILAIGFLSICGLCIVPSLFLITLDSENVKVEFFANPSEFQQLENGLVGDSESRRPGNESITGTPWLNLNAENFRNKNPLANSLQKPKTQLITKILNHYQQQEEFRQVFGPILEYQSELTSRKANGLLNGSGSFQFQLKGEGISGVLEISMERGEVSVVKSTINEVTKIVDSNPPENIRVTVSNLLRMVAENQNRK